MALGAHEKSGMANATPAIPLSPPMLRIIIEECDFISHVLGLIIEKCDFDSHVLGVIIEECDFISHVLGLIMEECDFNSHVLGLIMEELVFLFCTGSVLSDSTGMISKIFAFSLYCV